VGGEKEENTDVCAKAGGKKEKKTPRPGRTIWCGYLRTRGREGKGKPFFWGAVTDLGKKFGSVLREKGVSPGKGKRRKGGRPR